MIESRFWYLASPYAANFEDIARIAATLMDAGINIFCPTIHTHSIAKYSTRADSIAWTKLQIPIMHAAFGMLFTLLDGWADSIGMQTERTYFESVKKPIIIINPTSIERLIPIIIKETELLP